MKNSLIPGIRKRSDFLMALQLTGAAKHGSMANLQVRLPAIVIGGGLTAIDTATELFAYYPVQVEKILERYELMCSDFGEATVRAAYDREEQQVLDEFLAHGRAIRDERARAAIAGEKPNFIPLVRAWGGVSIAYRKSMLDSPAYRLNHEEVVKTLEEGIYYAASGNELIEGEGFFTSHQHGEKRISFYGDNHPKYAGNVVKAMASAKDGYPYVAALFPKEPAGTQEERDEHWRELVATLDDALIARVHQINRLTPTIVEVVVRAPMAARQFEPGQFYRLQNYETYAAEVDGTRLAMG